MASWHPADGSHGGLAGAPDAFCFTCGQYCGGLDAAGNPLVCSHCAALGLPPAEDGTGAPDAGAGSEGAPSGEATAVSADGAEVGTAPLLWGGQDVPLT